MVYSWMGDGVWVKDLFTTTTTTTISTAGAASAPAASIFTTLERMADGFVSYGFIGPAG